MCRHRCPVHSFRLRYHALLSQMIFFTSVCYTNQVFFYVHLRKLATYNRRTCRHDIPNITAEPCQRVFLQNMLFEEDLKFHIASITFIYVESC